MRVRSDAFLLDLCGVGDDRAFAELHRRHGSRVFAVCLGVLGSPHDAEDAAQEVWSSLASSLRASPPRELRAWLTRVARNAAIDLLRRRRETPDTDAVERMAGSHSPGADRERMDEVLAGLGELPERQRSALVMRELADYSYPEIAAALGVEEQAVSGLVARARISLRTASAPSELDCSGVRLRLAEELDGRRRPAELRRHLRSCEACADYLAGLRSDRSVLRSLSPGVAGAGLLQLFAISRIPRAAIGAGILAKAGAGSTAAKLTAFCLAGVCASAGVEQAIRHEVGAGRSNEAAAERRAAAGDSARSGAGGKIAAAATAAPSVFGQVRNAAAALPGAERPARRRTAGGEADGHRERGRRPGRIEGGPGAGARPFGERRGEGPGSGRREGAFAPRQERNRDDARRGGERLRDGGETGGRRGSDGARVEDEQRSAPDRRPPAEQPAPAPTAQQGPASQPPAPAPAVEDQGTAVAPTPAP